MYDPDAMPSPVPGGEPRDDRPAGNIDGRLRNPVDVSSDDAAAMRANYAGNVSLIDDQIGRLLEVIAQRGELDDTVIAFSSDHGEMNGDHGLIYKNNFFDGAVRVPMLLRTPQTLAGPVAGSVNPTPVEWFDLGPTLVELAGGDWDSPHVARSLCPVLSDPHRSHRPCAVSELSGEIMLLDGDWKIAINTDGEAYLLFNRRKDPDEQNNLAGRPDARETEQQLRLRILEHLVRTQLQQPRKR
jgi:choline-sulfatase